MYIILCLFGFIFVVTSSIVINYIYDIFPINKVTMFLLKPNNNSTWNKINICLLPTLIWSLVMLPVLGKNSYFSYAITLGLLVSMSIIYIIKTVFILTINKENNFINLISILSSTLLSQTIIYIVLKLGKNGETINSLIYTLCLLVMYILITIFPPNTKFFKN